MLKRILVANRGEIALRVIRTCREMGIETVAIHTPQDADGLHVRAADASESVPSYLDADAIVGAASRAGADAIHPGYGFLSESPRLATRCSEASIVFIGPSPQTLSSLGDKVQAREMALRAGIPVIPGATGSADDLLARASELGAPLMVKAVSGGGGKGMRRIDDLQGLSEVLAEASGEAEAAFGDGTLYLERCIEPARHVEVQILADAHGRTVHLMERECSIQRRHQKLVEESPSPTVDGKLREAMCEAAVNLASEAGYAGAGTVEFLVGPDDAFYFMEVNARLQVEHPVTEAVTGLDLVQQQILIAAGEPLAFAQEDVQPRGHAIECRLYAEDPASSFSPSPGEIHLLLPPGGPHVRLDSGVDGGSDVSLLYDPLLAKLVVWGPDRPSAVRRMGRALEETVILGVATTGGFLMDLLATEAFAQGRTHTSFIDEHMGAWSPDPETVRAVLVGCMLAGQETASRSSGVDASAVMEPFDTLGGWRMGGGRS